MQIGNTELFTLKRGYYFFIQRLKKKRKKIIIKNIYRILKIRHNEFSLTNKYIFIYI